VIIVFDRRYLIAAGSPRYLPFVHKSHGSRAVNQVSESFCLPLLRGRDETESGNLWIAHFLIDHLAVHED
jgi:hypothetical protein